MNLIKKKILYFFLTIIIFIIFISSLLNIYKSRNSISSLIKSNLNDFSHHQNRPIVNKLKTSERQIPPKNINDLIINKDADVIGQWSSPVDWSIIPLHSLLLPDETVMTFGSFSVDKKEDNQDIRSNKKITITDGRKLDRDGGSHQWDGHWVYSAIDFDIWNPKKGVMDDSHYLIKRQVVMDAFCSVARVIDPNRIFILGGNKNIHKPNMPDTQNKTMLYNVKDKKFELSQNLNFKRWYGSVVITGDEKMIIFGGKDVTNDFYADTPELLDLKNINNGWQLLEEAKSNIFFGTELKSADEWSYPRAFLTSDGNIVGISYNKIWVMDVKNNYRVFKTGEIPLVEGGITKLIENQNENDESQKENLRILTIGSPVGSTNSVVMIEKDKLLVFGGKQTGPEYSASNKVLLIDFSNSFKPKISELKSTNYLRSNGNATIMPDGNIFLNGGSAYNDDFNFSVFVPEIYNPKNQTSKNMDAAYFRRNYHSTALLLPDGRILIGGGDVWNAEIFYPPYLFTKNINNETILAKRPKIVKIEKNIKRGKAFEVETNGEISRVTLLSTGSTTHAQGSESKFRELEFFQTSKNKIEIKLDENPNNLQNGTYLIFVLDGQNIPSEGKIVFVN